MSSVSNVMRSSTGESEDARGMSATTAVRSSLRPTSSSCQLQQLGRKLAQAEDTNRAEMEGSSKKKEEGLELSFGFAKDEVGSRVIESSLSCRSSDTASVGDMPPSESDCRVCFHDSHHRTSGIAIINPTNIGIPTASMAMCVSLPQRTSGAALRNEKLFPTPGAITACSQCQLERINCATPM